MSLLSGLGAWLRPAAHADGPVADALTRVAGVVGPVVAGESAFSRRLAEPVRHALDYCDSLVEAVPGVIDIDRHAFADDPLVHALFAAPADIDTMLGRSLHLRDYLDARPLADEEHLYSLLAMRRHEKPVLGVALEGDTLRSDVPQTLLYFADHTLVELGPALDDTRAQLRLSAFDSLIAAFDQHLRAVRGERDRLRDDRAMESAHLAVLRGKSGHDEYAVRTRQVDELDRQLRDVGASLQPAALIDTLAGFLARPEALLRLEPVEVSVDRSGVIRDGAAAARGEADTIGFPELVARDRRRHVVVLARIRREDAVRAVQAIRDQQARYVVI